MNERIHVMRQSIVKLTQMLAGKGIQVTQQGITAYVKADANDKPFLVNLPYMPDNATEELIRAIQGFLDHEVAHILFTDFSLMKVANKVNAGSMLNLMEDARIEKAMGERFEGSAYNLAVTGKFFLEKYTEPKMKEAIATGNNDMLIGVLTVPLIRAMAGQSVWADYMKDKMPMVDEVYQKIKDLAPRIAAASSTADCLALAKEVNKRLRGDEEESDGGAGGGKAAPSKGPGGAGKAKAAPKAAPSAGDDEEDGAAAGEEPDEEETDPGEEDDASSPVAGEEPGDDGDDGAPPEDELVPPVVKRSPPKAPDGSAIDTTSMGAVTMDAIEKELANDFDSTVSNMITDSAAKAASESDYLVFTTDKDVIEPMHVGSGYKPEMLVELQSKVEHMVGPLQKDLERAISARSLTQYSSGHRSGRIHPANLTRLTMGDDRVFRRKQESSSKDVAVMLVVDASGSMNGSKIHTATQAAYALASVLERIGIKCEVVCFTTGEACGDATLMRAEAAKIGRSYSRYESLFMPILKAFSERMGTDVKARFGWLPNARFMASNVDGECVQIAGRRLLQRRETGKVMIVLSDGAPAASGGSGTLETHLKKVVRDISKAGVSIVGIGIESEAVKKFYPKNIVIRSVSELPSVVMKELRGLIVQ